MKIQICFLAAILALGLSGCGSEKEIQSESAAPPPAVSAPAAPKISETSEKTFQQALKQYGEGNHEGAMTLVKEALAQDGKNYKALSLQGLLLAFDGRPEEGIASIGKALDIEPKYTQAFFDMAMAQKLGKHYEASISYFQKVLAVDPQNTWSYYGIATNYADMRNKKEALAYLGKAMALDAEHVRPEAMSQDHFAWLRGDPDFQRIIQ